jgi:5-methylcytosine-specific restriction endonuclease McrA
MAIRDTRGGKCEACGRSDGVQLHHLKYAADRQPWEYDDNDFLLLCNECHKKEHDR